MKMKFGWCVLLLVAGLLGEVRADDFYPIECVDSGVESSKKFRGGLFADEGGLSGISLKLPWERKRKTFELYPRTDGKSLILVDLDETGGVIKQVLYYSAHLVISTKDLRKAGQGKEFGLTLRRGVHKTYQLDCAFSE